MYLALTGFLIYYYYLLTSFDTFTALQSFELHFPKYKKSFEGTWKIAKYNKVKALVLLPVLLLLLIEHYISRRMGWALLFFVKKIFFER